LKKYSDHITSWLSDLGYTHCFFIAGGNIMHLLNSLNQNLKMIPFVHEVGAAIACEYFNLSSQKQKKNQKALCLFTAGPGITNAVTGIAGSHLESREILILGGQVKTSDLKNKNQRQFGIQEIDGLNILKPVTKCSIRITSPIVEKKFKDICRLSSNNRKGAVFIEIPLDIQGTTIPSNKIQSQSNNIKFNSKKIDLKKISQITELLKIYKKPLILLGGGINSSKLNFRIDEGLSKLGIPFQTTWNGLDLVDSRNPYFFGRPNIWGQRYSNIAIQECDLLITIGCKMGLQQTGFNFKSFAPKAYKVMIDIDPVELKKKNYKPNLKLISDASEFLNLFFRKIKKNKFNYENWINYLKNLKETLPLSEKINHLPGNYVNPYDFMITISDLLDHNKIIIPCSSGSANTVTFQAFNQKFGQIVMNSKSLAAMGYGLSASIGAALSDKNKITILFEGDGGFIQNLQELGTLIQNNLNIKIFVFFDQGYASIRMTQKNYFQGKYIGCDLKTGLGLPNWRYLAKTYNLKFNQIKKSNLNTKLNQILTDKGSSLNLLHIHPDQTYYPKIQSRINKNGKMESNPLDLMHPLINLPKLTLK